MSETSDVFSGHDKSSGEIKVHDAGPQPENNGRPELCPLPDPILPLHAADEGGAEAPPIEVTGERFNADDVTQVSNPAEFSVAERPLFDRYEYVPPPPLPRRKPDFADCVLFALMAIAAFVCSGVLTVEAVHFHFFGVHNLKQANNDIHYRLGGQAAWYVITVVFSVLVFPLAWQRSFFAGLQWRAGAAATRVWRLLGAALACFVAALLDEWLMPGPANAPIDETFRLPGAVWLLFVFGVTLAPLIEEIAYRGFLLPALCTAWDWSREQITHIPPPSLTDDGFPRWSIAARVFGSIVVSVPFALMHGEQTAWSMGTFLLLTLISLLLCWVRLATRSLAASVVVHSCYNLLLFSMMFLFTGGFRHLDNM